MAGTLKINDHSLWMPASWVFNAVLEAAAPEVSRLDAALGRAVLTARTGTGSGRLDVTSWSPQAMQVLRDAVTRLRSRDQAAGPQALQDPTFFAGYMARVDELIEMLQRDPRAGRG